MADNGGKIKDVVRLRRTAKEVKKHAFVMRMMALLIIILVALVAIAYAVSYFYDKFGSFPEYGRAISVLNAEVVYDMTNISGEDLPENIDSVNGSHNGTNYIAYTFYLINSGDDTLSYQSELYVDNVSKGVDEAVRVAVFKNGEKTVYGKTKSNGKGIESDCDEEFLSSSLVRKEVVTDFEPRSKDKYTIVIWLEGNDPDCVDDIVGGTIKFGMDFKITETT